MKRARPIAAFLLASVATLILAGCPHRHHDDQPPPPPPEHHDGDHDHPDSPH